MPMYSLILEGTDTPLALSSERTILDSCLDLGVPVPYNCRSGECGECLAQLVAGRVQELPGADPAVFTAEQRDAGMILTCMCFPASDVSVRVPLRASSSPRIRQIDAIVLNVTWFGERTAKVVVRTDEAVAFNPGQYFEWHLPQLAHARSYSASNKPGSNTIEFLVRMHDGGGVSDLLRNGELSLGDLLSLKGPFGFYDLSPSDDRPLILLAGGTGVAPVKSIVEYLIDNGSRRQIKVFYGARDQAELRSADAFRALADTHASLTFTPVLSHEPEASGWTDLRGLVTDAMQAALGDAFGAQAYLCGPPGMIQTATQTLESNGVMSSDIHCDKFTPAGAHGA
jgi:NAD(P)H-flavin reductase/ferredoxin